MLVREKSGFLCIGSFRLSNICFHPWAPPRLHPLMWQLCTGHSGICKHAERDSEYECLWVRSLGQLSDWSLLFERVDE